MKTILIIGFMVFLMVPVLTFGQEKLTESEAQLQLAAARDELAKLEVKIADLESAVNSLKSQVASLTTHKNELQTKQAELTEAWKRCQYGRYTVIEGDWLTTIAAKREVYNNAAKWPTVFEANKDKIKNADLIYPGWVLLIPYLERYKVAPGDYLGLIASYLSVYSNAKRWPEIYEANRDKIKDADLIYPNQEFVIPHD